MKQHRNLAIFCSIALAVVGMTLSLTRQPVQDPAYSPPGAADLLQTTQQAAPIEESRTTAQAKPSEEAVAAYKAWAMKEPAQPDRAKIDAFRDWTQRWTKADAATREAMREEGARLARERRPEFKALIVTDPKQALADAVSRVVRQDLPPEIESELEKPVAATGEYITYLGMPAPGMPAPTRKLAVRKFETRDGTSYEAHVFGQMEPVMWKKQMPLSGVAVDKELAVRENPVRKLETGERIPEGTIVEAKCPVSGESTSAPSSGEVVSEDTPTVEIGEHVYTLCNGSHVTVLEDEYRTKLQASGPGGANVFVDAFPGTASRAIGNFRCLYIRVVYPDQLGAPNTEDSAYNDMANVTRYYLETSYGKMTTTPVVTPLVLLPHSKAWYYAKDSGSGGPVDCLGLIHSDARAEARKLGYDSGQFDCTIVRVAGGPRLDGISWGGGSSVWVSWDGMDVLDHECGHSLGLNHANFWSTNDGTAYGNGSNQEYGNDFDVMGGAYGFSAQYNTISKRLLGWLPDAYVHQPAVNGTYRIYAYDQPRLEEGKRYSFSVAKDSIRKYNLEFHYARGGQLASSALVLYSGMGSNAGHLLDTTPGSSGGKGDGGIQLGRTFSDLEADMHFTVVSVNNTAPPSLDIVYNRGPFPGNLPPSVSLSASATTISPGASVTFTATATDPNGDPLAYLWEFDDGVTGTNTSVFTRTFSSTAQITAMLTVSDMKGGITRRNVVINVGSHGKQMITGNISWNTQPLQNVRVACGSKYCYTDADGNYSLSGISTGSQTLSATLNGYSFTPLFTNPLTVVAGTNTADWSAGNATNFVSLQKIADAAEGGSAGVLRFARSGDTSAALDVRISPLGGTAARTTDYTFSPDAVADGSYLKFTIPAGQTTLDVTVNAVDDTAAEGPETLTMQLASNGTYLSNSANAVVLTIADNDTTLPLVSVSATDAYAAESPADSGVFTFSRTGSTASALDLSVSWLGAAINGTDYTGLPATITIPVGQSSTTVSVDPLNDTLLEGPEDVTASINNRPNNWVRLVRTGSVITGYRSFDGSTWTQVGSPVTVSMANTVLVGLAVNAHNNTLATATFDNVSITPAVGALTGADIGSVAFAGRTCELNGVYTIQGSGPDIWNTADAFHFSSATLNGDGEIRARVSSVTGSDPGAKVGVMIRETSAAGSKNVLMCVADVYNFQYRTATNGSSSWVSGGALNTTTSYVCDAAARTATMTLSDDDPPYISVSVPDPSASEAGPDSGVFLITRSGSTAAPLKVYYGLSGTALHGTDYQPLTGEVTIPAGATSAPVVITPFDDDLGEPTETVTLSVTTFNNAYSLGQVYSGTLTIIDNGDVTVVSVRPGAVGVEGGANATIVFRAIGSGSGSVTVNYTVSGTASPGSDYTALSGTVTVPASGTNDVTVTIPVINDTLPEPAETVIVKITPGAGYRVYNDGTATAVIRDNDSGDRVMISTWNDAPSESGAVGRFYVSRTDKTADLTVNYAISGTATNGTDYTTLPGTVLIPAGQSGADITVTPINDTTPEGTETITLTVVSGAGYGADNPASATLYLADNDSIPVTVGFAASSQSTTEQPGANGEYRDITVNLSAATANTVSVDYYSGGGSASGDDVDWAFVDANAGNAVIPGGTLVFPPGSTSQTIRVRIKNDGVTEGSETAILQLANAQFATLGTSQQTLLIFDEPTPTVTEERWNGTSVYTNQSWNSTQPVYTGVLSTFTTPQNVADNYSRRLTGQIVAPVTGSYTFWIASDDDSRLYLSTDSTAANKVQIAGVSGWTNYQSWDQYASQKSAAITLQAGQSYYMEVQHSEGGGGDHVSVAWQGPGFARQPIPAVAVNSTPITVRFTTSAMTWGEPDGTDPMVMVVLDRPCGATPITVDYSVVSGTATAGVDYQLTAGTLTFNSGEQGKVLPLTVVQDGVTEPRETIVIALSNPSGAQLGTPSAHTLTLDDQSQASGVWTNAAGGSWINAGNWSGGAIAHGDDKTADFSTLDLTSNATVTLDGARIIGTLKFGDFTASHNWTLNTGSGGVLTLDSVSSTPTITVNNQSATIGAALAGTKGFQKTGSGTAIVNRDTNTYTGATTVSSGELQALVSTTAGAKSTFGTDDVTVNSGATLRLKTGSTSNAVSWANNINLNGGTLISEDGNQTLNGYLTLTGTNTVNVVWSNKNLTIAGVVRDGSGPGSLIKTGVDSLILTNANTYTGNTSIYGNTTSTLILANTSGAALQGNVTIGKPGGGGSGGTLQLGANNQLTANSIVTFDHAFSSQHAYFKLNGYSTSIGGLQKGTDLGGEVLNGATTDSTLTIAGSGTYDFGPTNGWHGIISNGGTGKLSIVKSGTGTQIFSGANTYTGTTTVSAGTLLVNGSLANSAVTVANTATLSGTGTLNGTVTVQSGGILAPGSGGIGTLTINNTLSLSGTTVMEISKSGTTLTSDRFSGISTITFGGTLVVTNVGPDALVVGNNFTLFSAANRSGSFSSITLPSLSAGLVWDTSRLAVDGTISIGSVPVAADDLATTAEDIPATIAVLANDSDLDGDTLAIQSVTQGAHGVVTISGTSVTYTPAANWSGSDSFTYTATDNQDGTSTATVSVTVTAVNDAPLFTSNPISGSGATEDTAYSGSLASSATDADASDTLTFSKVSGPAWLSVAANGALSGTPSNSDVGANSFTVRVTDAGGAFAEATLNISVANVNDAPTWTSSTITKPNATESTAYSGSLAADASDIDAGDTLTFLKVSGPAWLSVAADGTLSGTPSLGNVGANSFIVRVTDAAGASADATLQITVSLSGSDGIWINAFGGSWTNSVNWSGGTIATNGGRTADFSTLNITADATITLDGTRTIGNLVFGDSTPSNNWTLNAGSGGALTLAVASGSPVVNVVNQTTTIGAVLSGNQGLVKTGTGTLALTQANSLTGAVTISQGTVRMSTNTSLGTGAITLGDSNTGSANVAWFFQGGGTPSNPITVSSLGTGTVTLGTHSSGTYTQPSSPLTLNRPVTLQDSTGDRTSFTGKISGPVGTITLTGSRVTFDNSANDFVGNVLVSNGTIYQNNAAGAVPDATDFTLNGANARFRLNNNSETIGALNGSGTVDNVVGSGNTLTVGGGNHSGTFTGVITNGSGVLNFAKTGTGTQTLSGSSTYTGTTSVNAGMLLVNGSLSTGAVTVANTATLGGTGTLNGIVTVQSGGTLAPGSGGIGTLTINNKTLSLSGTTAMEISKSGTTLTSDRASGISTVTYGGTLVVTNIGPDTLANGDTFTLFSAITRSGSFTSVTLPTLSAGLQWDTSQLSVNGTISVQNTTSGMFLSGSSGPGSISTPFASSTLPGGWSDANIGTVGLAGSSTQNGDTYTVSGSGSDIGDTADRFKFVSQTLAGDGEIRARVVSQTNTDSWAKAGVMIRDGSNPGAVNALVAITPGNGFIFQSRTSDSGSSSSVAGPALNPQPDNWVRLTRSGTLMSAYVSADGSTWTQVGTASLTMASSVSVGLAVTSHDDTQLGTATFDNVSVTPFPAPWQSSDIGNTGLQGSVEYFGSTYALKGAGSIGGREDGFRYLYQTLSGDGSIVARVSTLQDTGADASVGVMIRDTLTSNARMAALTASGSGEWSLERRTSTGGNVTTTHSGSGTTPNAWVRLVRSGTTITASRSADGEEWTTIGSVTVPMASNCYIGISVASGSATSLNSSVVDNVTVAP